MAHELDDIPGECECPVCGTRLQVIYKTLRLKRSVECPGCGETIVPEDGTPIAAIQQLIDEANRRRGGA